MVAACGEDAPGSVVTTSATSSTQGATTNPAHSTSAPPPATTDDTSPPAVSTAERLAAFFEAGQELDRRIKAAAELFNAGFDPDAGTVSEEATAAIRALDATTVGRLVPGGLSAALETSVLAVFAHLDSRIAALQGGADAADGDPMPCLGLGAESAARFESDLRLAQELASRETSSIVTPDSPEAGMVAVRLAYIHGANWCCDSCGGFAYDTRLAIDWDARVLAPGEIDAPFDAVFNGEYWQVTFPEAGAGVPGIPPAFLPNGLGFVSFGDTPELVLARVAAVLGIPATSDTGWVEASEIAPICPGPTVRIVEFDNLGLLFADDGYFAPAGTEQFVAYWYDGPPPLIGTGSPNGINVGSTVEDLLAIFPDAEMVPDTGRFGPTFALGTGGELLWGVVTGLSPDDRIISIFGGIGCGD
jgi:hypothetical protein